MKNTKAIVDFGPYTNPQLGPVAQSIHDNMAANAATFTTPPVAMPALQTQVAAYDAALVARASNATTDVLAFNEARGALELALSVLGNYVNSMAQGDPMKVDLSGFPSYETKRTPNYNPPAGPQNVRLTHGELPGTITARYQPARAASTNEVQCNAGDPNKETDWMTKGIFSGGRADLAGCPVGEVVYIRVRTVGLRGVMGAWSDAAQIRVM